MKQFTAGANEDGARLSRFVESVTTGLPASLLYKSFRNKRIKVNGKRQTPDYRLCKGDVVELYINDEFFVAAPQKPAPARRMPALKVVYEDGSLAVLYKPAHLLCHGDRTGDVSLVDAFIAYLAQKASLTRRRRLLSSRRCATGWTGAPRDWWWAPRRMLLCGT